MTWESWNTRTVADYYGQPVSSIFLVGDDVIVTLENGTRLKGVPEGDCCAYTEIVELTGDFTPGEPLKGIKTVALGSTDEGYDVTDEFIEIIAVGDKEISVLCKCHHNGYYGGWLQWTLAGKVAA